MSINEIAIKRSSRSSLPLPGKRRTGAQDAHAIPSNDLRWLTQLLSTPDPTDDALARQALRQVSDTFSRDLEPERMLLIAILKDAIDCIMNEVRRPRDHVPRKVKALRDDAFVWVFGVSDPDKTFSFEGICETLSIDVSYFRRELRLAIARARHTPVTKKTYAIRAVDSRDVVDHGKGSYHEQEKVDGIVNKRHYGGTRALKD